MARVAQQATPAAPRRTGHQLRRDQTRSQILGAVHRLLGDGSSFAELSVGRIAQTAGVSRATFYLHFHDKRDLLAGLAAQELQEWRDIATPLLTDPDAGREAVEATVRALVSKWQEHRAVLAAIVELSEYDEVAHGAWRATIETIGSQIAQYARARADSATKVGDPETISMLVIWMAERACHQMLAADSSARDVERLVQGITYVICEVAGIGE